MKRLSLGAFLLGLGVYSAGFLSHLFYQRWQAPPLGERVYSVSFSPAPAPTPETEELPLLQARDVDKIKAMSGRPVRIQGRIYRVAHSTKSNTYFLNFGPSRSSLTGVIFSSATGLFERKKIDPKSYEGKEVEIQGEVKDHPKYGLEIILEEPSQIRVLD